MNFLAHLYLSGDDPSVMVGNFIGDFVKGKNLSSKFDERVVTGIEFHRGIDYFTDRHPIVQRSKKRLFAKYRHYSGVVVDVFFDHFLAANWRKHHSLELNAFAHHAYTTLQGFDSILPEEVKRMLPYMINGNWLVGYAQVEGVHRALSGMASRTPYQSNMEHASHDLRELYSDFSEDFYLFFPDLVAFATNYLEQRSLPFNFQTGG